MDEWYIQVKRLRKKMGLSTDQFAVMFGVGGKSIGAWEAGGVLRPSAEAISKLEEMGVEFPLPWWVELRTIRETRGMTQAQAAAEIGTHTKTIEKWESGKTRRPHHMHIDGLARFGVDHSAFSGKRKRTPPNPGRPKKRSECPAPCSDGTRRCPWVSCRHHLGVLYFNGRRAGELRADDDPYRYACVLDLAEQPRERTGNEIKFHMSLEAIGEVFRVTRERIRQVEASAIEKLQRVASEELLDLLRPDPRRQARRKSGIRIER